ncbi:ABC transporter substrate-binding protein [Anaerobacillus alkalilacustris]|uniref:ABC transporter substrate-binding protein n=1 Tax=Anaerobacillus alkalilacustris TaxID=393763 RepID=A0A1S2LZ07_9BACI|nr:extracellular solute-binding protein [Anaerobacillus alkalilacustris]OIJ17480.1 ABC transporter substrate-binding protein [Anaerobacillus alkalilacustris]
MTRKKTILYTISALLIIAFAIILLIGKENRNNSFAEQLSKADYERSMAAIEAYISGFQSDSNYYSVMKQWLTEQLSNPTKSYTIDQSLIHGGKIYENSKNNGYGSDVIYVEPGDQLSFEVEVNEDGLYELWLDYYILETSHLNPELAILVNNEIQYNEMNRITLSMDWQPVALEGGLKYDRYGDELTPRSELISDWKREGLVDPNYFFTGPLKFKLDKGINLISISLNEGYLLIGEITVKNQPVTIPTYEEYRTMLTTENSSSEKLITIEAEGMSLKSRQSIRPKYVRDPQVTPYEYKTRVLNVLDGYSFGDSGDRVEYQFNVEESGYYHLTLKYSQDTNNGMPTQRRIEINGEVPFQELELYMFDYSSSWKNETLKDEDGNYFEIFLDKGQHTLTLSINNSNVRDVYHELLTTLEAMDSISRDILRLTGGLVDRKRVWRIERYIPDISNYLYGIAERIEEQRVALIELTGKDDLPVMNELEVAYQLIRQFAEKPDDLPNYMTRFNEGQSSAYGRIQTILPMLVYNPMHLDKFYFHSDIDLPRPNVSVVTSLVEGTKAFAYSFFNPKYNEAAVIEDDTIEVWVNQSRLYVEIMQRMIDEQFTPNTGIKVNLSLLPDENKIILSNAADSTPDAALGISHGRPFELALRGIVEDLRTYGGFFELAKQYNPNTFVPFIYDEGVYAMPETQDVKLLFYRKDILEFLGEEPPETWEDVVSLIPMLQRYDMNFFVPLGADSAYKGFDTTTPFIYQFGGELYNETGSGSVINQGGAYEAFDFMTSLFTVYNMPITTSAFYQNFRNGKSPVGIGDANLYIQLKHAAPELAGQWGMMPIPGVENDQGVIERWDPTYGSTAILFSASDKKEKAWNFIKWWTSAETQSSFSYDIQATLGNQFLYLTANIDGFSNSAWPSESKSAILEQWEWIQATGKVPGDYMVEREISNAWNKVVFDRENPRVAIDNAVKTIDRELERKLREFGYIENSQLIKPYFVPTIENVEKWVRPDGKEH